MNEKELAKWLRLVKERHTEFGKRIELSDYGIKLAYFSLGNAIDKVVEIAGEQDNNEAKTNKR